MPINSEPKLVERLRRLIPTFLRDLPARLPSIAKLQPIEAVTTSFGNASVGSQRDLSAAVLEFRGRKKRQEFIPKSLLGEPAWDVLLHLYIQEERGESATVASACEASEVPETSARRWLEALERADLIWNGPAKHDEWERCVGLTVQGHLAVSQWVKYRAALLIEVSEEA